MDIKYLACSDLQFPLHDKRALDLWLKVLKKFKPDYVDLVGDLDDSDSVSRWAEGTPDALISVNAAGAKDTREFLKTVRQYAPDADIHLFDGNHGWTRHEQYLAKNAPQYREQITPNTLYGHEDLDIKFHYYQDLPFNRFNDMYIHHGNAVSKHSGGSVQSDMESWGVSLIRGHSHRMGTYFKTYELTGVELEGYEIGHLMDVNKCDYTNVRNWQQGFLYGHVDTDAGVHFLKLVKIKNYTCYVNGVRYEV
jgi:hypothetical protein